MLQMAARPSKNLTSGNKKYFQTRILTYLKIIILSFSSNSSIIYVFLALKPRITRGSACRIAEFFICCTLPYLMGKCPIFCGDCGIADEPAIKKLM